MHVRVSVHAGACPCADAQAGVLLPRDRHGYEVPANHLTPMSPGAAAPCILSGWWKAKLKPPSAANWMRQHMHRDHEECEDGNPSIQSSACAQGRAAESVRKRARQRRLLDGLDQLEAMNYIWSQSVLRAGRPCGVKTTHTHTHAQKRTPLHTCTRLKAAFNILNPEKSCSSLHSPLPPPPQTSNSSEWKEEKPFIWPI